MLVASATCITQLCDSLLRPLLAAAAPPLSMRIGTVFINLTPVGLWHIRRSDYLARFGSHCRTGRQFAAVRCGIR